MSSSREKDAWVEAWAERYPAAQPKRERGKRIRDRVSRKTVVFASVVGVLVLLAPALAIAAGGGGQTFTSSNRYTLLVRNSGNGSGGATAQTCNTTPTSQACENNVNSGTGLAATYRTRGLVAAQFQTSGSGQATPFTISDNATSMVQNLNANMVGGLLPTQLFANYQQISQQSASVTKDIGQTQTSQVTCPSGTNIISQSGSVNQTGSAMDGQAVLQSVAPNNSTQATVTATVTGRQNSTATFFVTAFAVCAQT
ncbi:MAG TPA: hypothetical protein VHR88_12415 [Solirubrobacteraceae bacterium]|nr:hypothetical protein [Solirubrobacteraceae bacterium]